MLLLAVPLCAQQTGVGPGTQAGELAVSPTTSGTAAQDTTGNTAGPDFSLSLTPPPEIMYRGTHVSLTTIAVAVGGYSGPIKLEIEGKLPTWLQLSFTPATITPIPVKPTWNPSVASQLYIDATYIPTVKVSRSTEARHAALAFLPFLLLVPVALRRRVRRLAPLLAMAALSCLPFASGCGEGRYPPVVPAGVYLVNIVATGATGQQHTVPLLLRIAG